MHHLVLMEGRLRPCKHAYIYTDSLAYRLDNWLPWGISSPRVSILQSATGHSKLSEAVRIPAPSGAICCLIVHAYTGSTYLLVHDSIDMQLMISGVPLANINRAMLARSNIRYSHKCLYSLLKSLPLIKCDEEYLLAPGYSKHSAS